MIHRYFYTSAIAALATTQVMAQNIALNKPVVVVSGAGSLLAPTPTAGVVTDGLFLGERTSYSHPTAVSGALRWNTGLAGSTTIEIQLGANFRIDGILVQADDNDSLLVTYMQSNGTFQSLYNVPIVSVGAGFRTRPSADQTTFTTLTPITTSTIRVTNSGGDGFYGLSELQLRGVCVADFNADSQVDFFDYLDFVDAFSANQPSADFNQDSSIDFFDYLDFVDAFSQGC